MTKSQIDYQALKADDYYSAVTDLVTRGAVERLYDGRLHLKETIPLEMHPWIQTNQEGISDRRCNLWLSIYFFRYSIIPKGCRNCWKVFLRPKTLKELFEVKEVQERMNIPSKCGTEHRAHTGNIGGYAAFWYAPLDGGLEGARNLLTLVEKEFSQYDVRLKRGCTEMELKYNQSERWNELEEPFDFVEDKLNKLWIHENTPVDNVPMMRSKIMSDWITFASAHGDETYKEFTHGQSLTAKLTTYEDSVKFPSRNFESSYEPAGIKLI